MMRMARRTSNRIHESMQPMINRIIAYNGKLPKNDFCCAPALVSVIVIYYIYNNKILKMEKLLTAY